MFADEFGPCRVDHAVSRRGWLDESAGNCFEGIRENGATPGYIQGKDNVILDIPWISGELQILSEFYCLIGKLLWMLYCRAFET